MRKELKLYIKIDHLGRNWYLSSYDYYGHKIDVSKPFKTRKACIEQYDKVMLMSHTAPF